MIHVYISLSLYIYIYIYVYIYIYTRIHTYTYIIMHIYTYMRRKGEFLFFVSGGSVGSSSLTRGYLTRGNEQGYFRAFQHASTKHASLT